MLITRSRLPLALAAGLVALALLAALSLAVGSFPVEPRDVAGALWSVFAGDDAVVGDRARAIVLEIRAPRVAAALGVGAALGAAGAAYQNVFRNPLVSPDILGVSSGCALGAVAGILAGLPAVAVQGLAFAGGIAVVGAVLAVASWVRGHDRVLTLVLTGVVVGSLFSAGVAFAKTLADPYNQLPAITFWLLGSFSGVVPRELGIDVLRVRVAVIAAATLVTSASVAIAGIIGWVGLLIPHAARLLVGAEFARVLPVSAILGATFLLAVDTLCRTIAHTELPPGVLTALLGTPVFIWLLAVSFRRPA
jgi:iron complex transport system permease protein